MYHAGNYLPSRIHGYENENRCNFGANTRFGKYYCFWRIKPHLRFKTTIAQSDPLAGTGDEVRSFDIIQFQAETLDKARRALCEIPARERDISVLTVTASEECMSNVNDDVRQFRKKLLRIVP